MEALVPLLVGILVVPILIVVLLLVYIAKTNRLSRDTNALRADVSALRTELTRLRRSLVSAEHHPETVAEAATAGSDRQPVSELGIEAPSLALPRIEPELAPPSMTAAANPQPPEPEVYASPYRPRVAAPVESAGAPSQLEVESVRGERNRTVPAPASGPRYFSSRGDADQSRSAVRTSRTRAEWESLIGGRLLNWIGALAIIIGVGFFLGYGYQNNWITPALLVAIGAIAGLALLAGGDLSFRKGFRVFSQGLVGAGISVLYLSAYASFNFHLEGQAIAFLMMCAVTVLTFVQAFRFNSLSVSLLGWAGGFLTPVLLSTGQANEIALFAYISILDAGLLAVVAVKDDWVVLQPLTLIATYLIYIAWYVEFYSPDSLLTTAVFLTIFWSLFHALDVWKIVKFPQKHLESREPVAIFNAVFYYAVLYLIIDPNHHDYLATVTLGLGAAYLLTVAAIRGVNPPRLTEARFALTGSILLVIATALRFTGFDTVFCWSMESLALVLAAVYWKEPGVLGGAALLYLAAIAKLLAISGWFGDPSPETFVPVLNRRTLAFLGLAAAGALGAKAIRRASNASNRALEGFFEYSWCLALFLLIAVETQDEFRHLISTRGDREWLQFVTYLAIGVAWMVYALVLARYGANRGLPAPLTNVGLFAVGASVCTVAIAGFSYEPIAEFMPIINVRVAAFAAVLISLLVLLGWTAGDLHGKNWPRWTHSVFLAVFCLMIFVLCTAETRDYFGKLLDPLHRAYASGVQESNMDEAVRKYTNLEQVALSLVWLVYSILLIGYGIWRRALSLRIIAIAVFGIAILKIFIYDLSFLESLYRIFSFIGLGLILLSVSFLYQRFKSAIFESGAPAETQS